MATITQHTRLRCRHTAQRGNRTLGAELLYRTDHGVQRQDNKDRDRIRRLADEP